VAVASAISLQSQLGRLTFNVRMYGIVIAQRRSLDARHNPPAKKNASEAVTSEALF